MCRYGLSVYSLHLSFMTVAFLRPSPSSFCIISALGKRKPSEEGRKARSGALPWRSKADDLSYLLSCFLTSTNTRYSMSRTAFWASEGIVRRKKMLLHCT